MTGIRPQTATNARNLIRWGCLHWLQLGSYSNHVNGTPDQCVLGSSTTRQPSVDVWSHADYEARSCVYTLLLNRGSGPACMKLRKALPGFGGQFSYGISQLVLLPPPPGQSTTLLQQAVVQVSMVPSDRSTGSSSSRRADALRAPGRLPLLPNPCPPAPGRPHNHAIKPRRDLHGPPPDPLGPRTPVHLRELCLTAIPPN